MITWRELGEAIANMSDEQKDMDIIICDRNEDEWIPAGDVYFYTQEDFDSDGVLDHGSPYLTLFDEDDDINEITIHIKMPPKE